MRIASRNIPEEKRLVISLQYIYGIGSYRSSVICKQVEIDESVRVKDLTVDQQESLRAVVGELGFVLESDLKRSVMQDIRRLQEIGTYRGFRHRRKLPVRGQRTKTNSRTRRGAKMTIANKKKVTK